MVAWAIAFSKCSVLGIVLGTEGSLYPHAFYMEVGQE